MRLVPRSLFGRLLAIGGLSTLVALLLASLAIGHVLERFVMRGFDDRLDAQLIVLARAVRPDGSLDPARAIDLPGYGEAGSGWVWQVDGTGGRRWRSSPDTARLDTRPAAPPMREPPHAPPEERPDRRERFAPAEGRGGHGERLHFRTLTVASAAGPVTITASGPRRVMEAPLREAMLPLLGSLGLLGIGLCAATLIQLRIGLRPLRALQAALGEVIAGRARHVPVAQPAELAPLATELNLLIDQNAAGLEHARRHVANLAHGLKTPLAALALKLAETARDPDGDLAAMVASIDRRVSHHLRRARAAAPGGTGRASTPLRPAIDDLVAVLRRVHADRPIAIDLTVAGDLAVQVDAQDLDEMAGNLLDNAWRHARATIRVSAVAEQGRIVLAIEDDGPGLDDAGLAEALLPGRRLDEREPGHGFGLPITQELAELNGGGLLLSRAAGTSGLRARLTLPAAHA